MKHMMTFEATSQKRTMYEDLMKEISHFMGHKNCLWTIRCGSDAPGVALAEKFADWKNSPKLENVDGLKRVAAIDRELIDFNKLDFLSFYDVEIPSEVFAIAEKGGLAYDQSVGIHDSRSNNKEHFYIGILFKEDESLMYKHRGHIKTKRFGI